MAQQINSSGTRARLLEAAEALFIELGYEGMSLRQITTLAGANLAAVNYHFGSKEALVQELLSLRLDRLNQERLQLLSACEESCDAREMSVSVVLSILFVPALRLTRDRAGGPAFMQLLGRVYSDPSPFVRTYLNEHYQTIYERFFAAFARALPDVPRAELGVRLQFSLKALAGVLASENMDELIAAMCIGEKVDDSLMLARLIAFIGPMLSTPFGKSEQIDAVTRVSGLASAAATAVDVEVEANLLAPKKARDAHGVWAAESAGS